MKNIADLANAFGKADSDFRDNVFQTLSKLEKSEGNRAFDPAITSERRVLRGLTRRFAIAAVVVALALTATAFAMGYYLGSFDRLREIIGAERAGLLRPVEVSKIVGENVADAGFNVELVAVGVDSNVVDLYLTLEDLDGNRLDGDFQVWALVRQVGRRDFVPASLFSDIISRTDNGVVTLRKRTVFTHSIMGHELEFMLESIEYGFRTEELAIDLSLSTVSEQTPVAQLWDTPILPPHLHDIEVSLEGFEYEGFINISSIGIIDGRLHIQENYDLTALRRWSGSKVSLIDPGGEVVSPVYGTYYNTGSVSFRIDEQGNFYNDLGFNFVADFPYHETIFEVDLERLSEYRLVAFFDAHEVLRVSWAVQFKVEAPDETAEFLVADELNIWVEQYLSTITTVEITPNSVIMTGIQGLHTDNPVLPDDAVIALLGMLVRLNMADGSVVGVTLESMSMDAETRKFTDIRLIDAEPIALESVLSIEIDGEVILFR